MTPSTLWPARWPIRWRLAAVSAGLTLIILLVFGVVVGQLASQRLRQDFNQDLRSNAESLANHITGQRTLTGGIIYTGAARVNLVNGASTYARLLSLDGRQLRPTLRLPDMGPAIPGIRDIGRLRVVTVDVTSPDGTERTGYIQYARSKARVESATERLWLSIAAGILGATLLACLAGLALAARAMRPISRLTATAGKIAATRDPSMRIPIAASAPDDEVGELASTLSQMLHSLDQAQSEREQAMARQREFVADASHELRTPLTSVLANLELLQESLATEGDAGDRDSVSSALRSSRRMRRLVADLQLLARADAGRLNPHTDCDLAEILRDAVSEIESIPGGDRVSSEIPDSLPVHGNHDELLRVAVNLIENAVRHTPPDTSIEVRGGSTAEAGGTYLQVDDDGPGIPAEMREHIFERFVRSAGPGDTASGTGSGLGLAIVKAVADIHGGTVTVSESDAGGASFRLELPPPGDREQAPRKPLVPL